MDKATRNHIQRATQAGRTLLERTFSDQLEGTFDILLDGTIAEQAGSHLSERQKVTREKLVAAVAHKRSSGLEEKDAVSAYLREAAFTVLNQFVALKMLEARELVQECVSKGEDSSGFKEFTALAPGLVAVEDKGYRLYIETVFDEIGQEVKVLFDRHAVASLLWPGRQTLLELLGILNAAELASVWAEDETIGWVYQYFNGDEERTQMRKESQAPRNSRELAVRNQFFTPRYVVQFLTDNTLGRTWYEMMQGETKLTHLDYLVRRPNEVFLAEGESTPESDTDDSELSQEELLQQTVHVPFRAKKDPRDLRILDPACGSGHFLLYTFELLIPIYEEAWADASAAAFAETSTQLRADYESLEDLRCAMPELILRHNLHGVDIDPRAAQIAALALWMRAQRAYNQFEVDRAQRPPITKTNIVVAEPMPGDAELVEEFAASLKPAVLGDLFKKMVEEMKLAGELGSLLKIEESIAKAVKEASEANQQGKLFAGKVEGQDFWDTADEKIIAALGSFAESAAGAHGVRRQLFAGDAAQGVAFIELMRKRFDTVLMNPPFGDGSTAAKRLFHKLYPRTKKDLYAAFVERGLMLLHRGTLLGAITSRTGFFLSSFQDWRERVLLEDVTPTVVADLGGGVMDAAMVEAAAYCLAARAASTIGSNTTFFRLLDDEDKREALLNVLNQKESPTRRSTFVVNIKRITQIPTSPFAYWAPDEVFDLFSRLPSLRKSGRIARTTNPTTDDFRFARAWWEPSRDGDSRRWRSWNKGGGFSPYYRDVDLVIDWDERKQTYRGYLGTIYRPDVRPANLEFFFRPGLTWVYRGHRLCVQAMPEGTAISTRGNGIYASEDLLQFDLGLLNSSYADFLIKLTLGRGGHPQFDIGDLNNLPVPEPNATISEAAAHAWSLMRELDTPIETSHAFLAPALVLVDGETLRERALSWTTRVQEIESTFSRTQQTIDRASLELYGVGQGERGLPDEASVAPEGASLALDGDMPTPTESRNHAGLVASLLSWVVGVSLGRFDVRIATGERESPAEPGLFDPLPSRSPGMLSGEVGTTLTAPPPDYTLAIPSDGILLGDTGHRLDIEGRVSAAFELVFDEPADRLKEAAELVCARDPSLRVWFAKDYFPYHVKQYSKSRRRAPIYWQLATPSASYSVWCYYHRLTRDTFFRVANDYVAPKVDHEERKLNTLRQEAGPDPSSKQRKEIDTQETFVAELRAFLTEVKRIAPLWNPNLNDGVIINFAPLWRLVPQHKAWQKECKKVWDTLVKGDYDWAHLAMHLWPERVVPKCPEDRSLAIAHGLEREFWYEDEEGKWQERQVSVGRVEKLVSDRSSTTVKAALKDLLETPAPTGSRARSSRKGRG